MIKKKLRKILAPRLRSLKPKLAKVENYFLEKGKQSPFRERQPSLSQKISLIVPTYNVEKYFDQFMRSVLNQSTGLHNLEVIVVDDGSPDSSGEKARAWQLAYPNTIKYIRQENQGLCGARNTGLANATGDWVSFPDPDDFFDRNYLHQVNRAIIRGQQRKLSAIVANFIIFDERSNRYRDTHGLKYRFVKGESWFRIQNMGDHIHLAVNSCFLKRSVINKHNLTFDPRIKPGFEDAHFVNRYFIRCQDSLIAYLKNAIYNYRKRADESSLQDVAKQKKEFYINQPEFGWVALLREAKEILGYVPRHIQRAVLYDTVGRLDTISRIQKFPIPLSTEELQHYKKCMIEAFSYIDTDVIASGNIKGFYENLKVGCLSYFKGAPRTDHVIYARNFNPQTGYIEFVCFTGGKANFKLVSGSNEIIPFSGSKNISFKFFDDTLYIENILSANITSGTFQIFVDDTVSRIKVNNKLVKEVLSFNELLSASTTAIKWNIPRAQSSLRSKILASRFDRYDDCWLVMDRIDKADDNGEHFYKYLITSQKQQNSFFVLSKKSRDWDRLAQKGFQLIDYGSVEHMAALVRATWVISSHGDRFIRDPFPDGSIRDLCSYKFAFIQHGVTLNDQAEWFNVMQPSLLIAATNDEYISFTNDEGSYTIGNQRIRLTGFSRHDSLLEGSSATDTIFIMPTWRQHLTRMQSNGIERSVIDDFENSSYVKNWRELLNSPKLTKYAQDYGKDVVFCPHPNIAPHLESFKVPPFVKVINSLEIDTLQDHFKSMALMITDYSSVAFEAGYLNKPVIYFQFDQDTFFENHYNRSGYFKAETHGFGPVAKTVNEVENDLHLILNGDEDPAFKKRRIDTFPFRDGKCSERVYNAIIELNEKRPIVA